MPNTFKNSRQVCTTSLTDMYTCPSSNGAGTVAASVVLMLQASNVTNRADTLTVVWTDASNSNAVTRLTYQIPVPANQSVGLLTGKLALEVGDKIRAQCGTHQAIELSATLLETA